MGSIRARMAGVACALLALVGCVEAPGDGTTGGALDGEADAGADASMGDARVDGGEGDEARPPVDPEPAPPPLPPIAPGPRNERFPHAWAHPSCDADGAPALVLSLGHHAVCDFAANEPDRLQLYIEAQPGLAFPLQGPLDLEVAPGTALRGLYFDADGQASMVSGRLQIERVDPRGASYGTYRLESADGAALEGAFEALFCWEPPGDRAAPDCYPYGPEGPPDELFPDPPPEPEPAPEPIRPEPPVEPGEHCEGRYTVVEWAVTEVGFRPEIINEMLEVGIEEGDILLDVIVRADSLKLLDVTLDAAGVRLRSPEVPDYAPMPIVWDAADALVTAAAGQYGVWLSESSYARFEPLLWEHDAVEIEAEFAPDCAQMVITQTGHFDDLGYSLGGQDVDLDGDGLMDAWSITTRMVAEPL